MLTDNTGIPTMEYSYDIFGSTSQTGTNEFLFTGERLDLETGLIYLRARYYDPETGTFVTKDPLGLRAGLNSFVYVKNGPVNSTDPHGLDPITINLYEGAVGFGHVGGARGYGPETIGFYTNSNIFISIFGHAQGILRFDDGELIGSITIEVSTFESYAFEKTTFEEPLYYNLFDFSCVDSLREGLSAAGISSSDSNIPKVWFDDLKRRLNEDNIQYINNMCIEQN